MGQVLPFPQRQPSILERLDASIVCMYRLQVASGLPNDEMRVEALGARLDMASLTEAMYDVLSDAVTPPQHPTGMTYVWAKLEDLLDQVVTCASSSYSEHPAERSCAIRAQLRGVCQATLRELYQLRSMLTVANCAET